MNVTSVNNVSSVNFHSDKKMKFEKDLKNNNFKDMEKLANSSDLLNAYGMALVGLNRTMKNEAAPLISDIRDIDKIEGEKIYKSNGDLYCIEQNNNDGTKTLYYPDLYQKDKIENIQIVDNKSNKILKQQQNTLALDYQISNVVEYSDNQSVSIAIYENGNLQNMEKIAKDYDNGKIIKHFDNSKNESSFGITIERDYGSITTNAYFDKNNDIKNITLDANSDNKAFFKNINFDNGMVTDISENKFYKSQNVKNISSEKLANLKPLDFIPREELQKVLSEVEGDNTYYSNGALESTTFNINDKSYKVTYAPNGEIIESESPDMRIWYNNLDTVKVEKCDGESCNTTIYANDKILVDYNSPEINKTAVYSKDGKLVKFMEFPKNINTENIDK